MQLVRPRDRFEQFRDGLLGLPDFRLQVLDVYGNPFLEGRNLALQLDAQVIELAGRDIEATQNTRTSAGWLLSPAAARRKVFARYDRSGGRTHAAVGLVPA